MKTLELAGIVPESIVDGPGIRYTIFVQGCPHHCEGCHNPQTHAFGVGTEAAPEDILAELDKKPYLQGVTLSGGEPFCQAEALAGLAAALKAHGKHIMAYTGYTFEQLLELDDPFVRALLEQLDLLVDGRFVLAEKSIELKFRGSANQRVLDVPASLAAEKAVWAEQYR
ncbi:MAG: anaerobic ribonucleoside-triphosphate reductase activating protein [Butyricicoccus sp.]